MSLGSCTASPQTSTQIPTPTFESATITVTTTAEQTQNTVVPTPTKLNDTPTPTPFPDIPDFIDLEIAQNPVLLSSEEGCILPCFRELRVGSSTFDDAVRMYEDVFELNGQVNFSHLIRPGFPFEIYPAPGISSIRFGLEPDPQNHVGLFSVSVVFDTDNIVQGVTISQLPESQYSIGSLQAVVQNRGVPDYIEIGLTFQFFDPIGVVLIELIYFDGMSIRLDYEQSPISSLDSPEGLKYPPFCFDTEPVYSVTYLVTPFDSIEIENPTATQFEGITVGKRGDQWKTVEEQLDLSIAEFTSLVTGPNPCLEIDFLSD